VSAREGDIWIGGPTRPQEWQEDRTDKKGLKKCIERELKGRGS